MENQEVPQNIDLFSEETGLKYPHGIYSCGCGKHFHGHLSRDAHSFNCEIAEGKE